MERAQPMTKPPAPSNPITICYLAYPTSLMLRSANAIQTWTTLRELRRHAPQTLALIPSKWREPSRFRELGAVHLLRPGIGRLSRLYKTTLLYYLEHTAWAWMCFGYLLLQRLRGRRYDVIYIRQIVVAAWWAGLLGKLYGAKVVYEAHDWESSNPSRAKEPWARGLLHLLDRVALTKSDAVVSLTEHFLRELERIGWHPHATAVIPDAFDADVYQPQDRDEARQQLSVPTDDFVIVYAGMTFSHRGLDRLVDAFAAADIPNAQLIFVGGRPAEVATLQAQVAARGIKARVQFVAPQPQPVVSQYLAAADVLAIPDTVTDVTASPLKLFEYMAMGRAIITVDLPALREVIDEQAARFVQRGIVNDLQAALQELADDPERRGRMGQQARIQSAPWTYTRRAERILEMAQGLIEKHLL
jgi:glycosyltransferase involved in cell wall biosynthesis